MTCAHTFPIDAKDQTFNFSSLFAYKLNWQTVFYLGYGDDRAFASRLTSSSEQSPDFAKISYASNGSLRAVLCRLGSRVIGNGPEPPNLRTD